MNEFVNREQVKAFAAAKFKTAVERVKYASMIPADDTYAVINDDLLIIGNLHEASNLTVKTAHPKVVLTANAGFVATYGDERVPGEIRIGKLSWNNKSCQEMFYREFYLCADGAAKTLIDEKIRSVVPFENSSKLLITASEHGWGRAGHRHFVYIFDLDKLSKDDHKIHPSVRKYLLPIKRPLHAVVSPDETMAALTFGANPPSVNQRSGKSRLIAKEENLSLSSQPFVLIFKLELSSPKNKDKKHVTKEANLINAFDSRGEPKFHQILYSQHFTAESELFKTRGSHGDPVFKIFWRNNEQLEIRLLDEDRPQLISVSDAKF